MIISYPVGVPLLYLSSVWRVRAVLLDKWAMEEEVTEGHPVTGHLLFLHEPLRPEYYWFEVANAAKAALMACFLGADYAASPLLAGKKLPLLAGKKLPLLAGKKLPLLAGKKLLLLAGKKLPLLTTTGPIRKGFCMRPLSNTPTTTDPNPVPNANPLSNTSPPATDPTPVTVANPLSNPAITVGVLLKFGFTLNTGADRRPVDDEINCRRVIGHRPCVQPVSCVGGL